MALYNSRTNRELWPVVQLNIFRNWGRKEIKIVKSIAFGSALVPLLLLVDPLFLFQNDYDFDSLLLSLFCKVVSS